MGFTGKMFGMDLYEFNLLNSNQKADLLWNQGQLLIVRDDAPYTILLYHVGKFFAEVWYDQKRNEVFNIISFKKSRRLEPYLEQVDITSLTGQF